MATYLSTRELRSLLGASIKQYVEECLAKQQIPEELVELIKHNFYAKYVHYNKEFNTIEIGVNESKTRATAYPEIKVISFPIEETSKWVDATFIEGKGDLEFYAKIISRNDEELPREVVLL